MAKKSDSSSNAKSVADSLKKSTTQQSAEEKLKKSLKSLSYTSGTSGGTTTPKSTGTRSKTSSAKTSSAKESAKEERKKVGGVVLDVETIQGATKQKFETRGRRNNVVILVLVLALVVSLVFLAISVVDFQKSKQSPNLKYFIEGSAGGSCEWSIDGGPQTKFVLVDGLSSGMKYDLSSSIKINTPLSVNITIEIIALLNGEPIGVDISYEGNNEATFEKIDNISENKFKYIQTTYSGGGILHVFDSIDFTDAPHNLTSKNIKLDVVAHIEFV